MVNTSAETRNNIIRSQLLTIFKFSVWSHLMVFAFFRKYNYATPEHLYENLQKALDESTNIKLPADLSISRIMRTWVEKEGYPVVHVKRQYSADTDTSTVSLSQVSLLMVK